MENQIVPFAGIGMDDVGYVHRIRVAIVEDMQFLAEMLGELCRQIWGMEVVAISHLGNRGYEDVLRTKPDVVLLDFGLPDVDGATLAEKINATAPGVRIIVISSGCSDYQLSRLHRVRIHGFFDKVDEGMSNLRGAIELVHLGASYFSARYVAAAQRLRRSETAFFKLLSPREQEFLVLAAQALSDEEIASHIGISASTAQTHRRAVMRKLNIHSTPKLIRYGMDLGLGNGAASLLTDCKAGVELPQNRIA